MVRYRWSLVKKKKKRERNMARDNASFWLKNVQDAAQFCTIAAIMSTRWGSFC